MLLDRIDCGIVAALQKNGRMANKDLAALVGIAASTCIARVRRLEESGVIQGFHATVDAKKLGVGLQAIVAVRLRQHVRNVVDGFREHALSLPEAVHLFHMSGANDYLVHVAVRDPDHLRELVLTAFTTRSEVAHIETSLIFEHVHGQQFPIYVEPHNW